MYVINYVYGNVCAYVCMYVYMYVCMYAFGTADEARDNADGPQLRGNGGGHSSVVTGGLNCKAMFLIATNCN